MASTTPTHYPRGRWSQLLVCLLVLGLAASCGADEPESGRTALTSEDGALELTVPASWSEQEGLNEVAAIQAGDPDAEAYVVLIEDPRAPFEEMDLGKFADNEITDLVSTVGLANLSNPRLVIIDDREAVQYELRGFYNSVEVVYLYTFVETPDRFLKVVAWSLAEKFEANREVLEETTESVRQLAPLEDQPSPSPPPATGDVPDPVPSADVIR